MGHSGLARCARTSLQSTWVHAAAFATRLDGHLHVLRHGGVEDPHGMGIRWVNCA